MTTEGEDSSHLEYNVVVLGTGGVGKSALTIRLVTGSFLEDCCVFDLCCAARWDPRGAAIGWSSIQLAAGRACNDPTIGDSYRKNVFVDEEAAILDLLDTAGQEGYSSMQDQWIRAGEGYLLVYSVTSRDSFDAISMFKDKILRTKDADKAAIVIAGNKCDMINERQVQTEEGRALAERWGVSFMETSAKEQVNIDDAFFQVVREIRKEREEAEAAAAAASGKGKKKRKNKKKETKPGETEKSSGVCLIL